MCIYININYYPPLAPAPCRRQGKAKELNFYSLYFNTSPPNEVYPGHRFYLKP
jgi:hypothetical protein